MVHQSRTVAVALFLVAVVVLAASVPAATAYGCFNDCYERCANGKLDPACVKMCNEACVADKAKADVGAGPASAPTA